MIGLELAVVLCLVLVNGLLAMAELAIISSRRSRLQMMVERRVRGARRALALAADPGRFLSTVQIGITLVGILAGAFSGTTLGERMAGWLIENGLPVDAAEAIAVGAVVTVITYLSLIVGELVPKQLALRNAEGIACAVAPAMTVLARVAYPLVWILDHSSRLILRLLRQRPASEVKVTDEEIQLVVAEAETAGVLEPEERAMIAGVMRLGDRTAKGVMTPRVEVDLLDLISSADQIIEQLKATSHSKLPVRGSSPDEILGVVQINDFIGVSLDNLPNLSTFVRKAPIIPETMDALEIIGILKRSGVHMGLVYDEYGHFEGVVTAADILESIVGQFRSQEQGQDAQFVARSDGSFLVDGAMPIDELAERLSMPLPPRRGYHTLAGLILSATGRLPKIGESIELMGLRFEVVDLDGRRIDRVLVSRR